MRFFVATPIPTIKLKILTGPGATEIYSQDVPDYNVNTWTEITLDTPVTIDANTQLWAGLNIDMPVPGAVMGCDEGPAIAGYGDLYKYNGTWYNGGLNWNIQIQVEEPDLPTYLHWDSGENATSFGNFLQPIEMDFVTKWDPDHIAAYDGWTLTKMRFYLTNPSPTVKLKIWTGPGATEIYSQDISDFNVNDWTEITLDTPVTIDASTQFWAGLNIDMPVTGAVIGQDEGPAIDNYGNIYRYNGTWYSDFNRNWNIQLQVEDPNNREVNGLLGYNIYRDDEQINQNTWTSTSYVDENMLNGTYDYYVTAVYDEGESDPTDTIEVVISQPVINYADSMALVDLYNNCNGPNWATNDLWLEGPVNEWYGVTTTGTRVTSLWRQSNNLTGDIPESIGDLTALEQLHLESNTINSIPESIGNLRELEILWLGWNPLVSVPESIGNLVKLKQLHLGSMDIPLGTLPDSICNLVNLEWFALGGSGLNSLPDNFGNLTSLVNLFLWSNNLTELPAGFGDLESLQYLILNNNQLTTLPDSFGDLDQLSQLFIEDNQLTHFPESFGDLASLDSLWVRFNQISSLPESFGNLSDLNLLKMSVNNLTSLPASFSNLATVNEVYLDNNQIASLPDNFGNFPMLELMILSTNNITAIPESIGNISSLKTLFLNNNQIEAVPESIGNLSSLQSLGLGGNNISVIPESIGNLSTLGYIGITNNNITALPETFGNLEADTVLISNNQIAELPASMFDNIFQYLLVQENALQFGSIEPLINSVTKLFIYEPQAMIGTDTTITAVLGQTVNYTIEVSGENNVYTWYKNGIAMGGQNTNTLQLQNIGNGDAGIYQLKVTNTIIPDLTLESYNMELVIVDCIPWDFIVTAEVHSIIVPTTANPSIDGEPLQAGDWIGVFFLNDVNQEVCGGAVEWNALGNVVVMAYGDDPLTSEKDGFANGEEFRWRMYQCGAQAEHQAVATYDQEMPNLGFFADFGSSKLTSLVDASCQYFQMQSGWNSVSSYVIADNPDVEEIMAPVVNDLILMRNLTQLYWPEETINTIGDWDNTSGYAMKFYNDAAFDICGSSITDKNLAVNAGWSYLPVPSECDVDAIALFNAYQDDIIFAQDLIGTHVYWPEMGIYTLDVLNPGKAYKLKTNNALNITFPDCVKSREPSFISRKNTLSTPWGEFNMTPSSENVVIFADALKNLETGDIIAAFNQNNLVCGMMEISNTNKNQSLILFGDDPTTLEADGFTETEMVSYKLYRTRTDEEFVLDVEYNISMENSTGLYYSGSFAGITNITTSITSIDEMGANDVKLYPNPARDVLTIDFEAGTDYSADVSIFNTQGRIVMQEIISNGKSELNVSSLKQGVYFVKINTSNFNKTIKLVIK
jgi:Leucine-rich repeat (LRR) protein